MKRYRTRPKNVIAIQWFPGVEVPGWIETKVDRSQVKWGLLIDSRSYQMTVIDGQWIVINNDHVEVLNSNQFEAQYELIPSSLGETAMSTIHNEDLVRKAAPYFLGAASHVFYAGGSRDVFTLSIEFAVDLFMGSEAASVVAFPHKREDVVAIFREIASKVS